MDREIRCACGKRVRTDWLFCPKCGKELKIEESRTRDKQNSSNAKRVFIASSKSKQERH